MVKYFSYDHLGKGFEFHNTEQEAKEEAQRMIDFYLQNDHKDFIDVHWGEIRESSQEQTDEDDDFFLPPSST